MSSDWWNPLSWEVFSDWSGTSWAEELGDAVRQAYEWVSTTAEARGWSAEAEAEAGYYIATAEANASGDVGAFWSGLSSEWPTGGSYPAGWSDLADAWASASGTVRTTEAARDEGSLGDVAAGTAKGISDDIVESSTWLRTWGPWIAGVVVVLLLLVFVYVKANKGRGWL